MENCVDGDAQFELDRIDLIECTLAYIKGRFDPLLDNKVLKCMRDSFEHWRWPPIGDPRLAKWGVHEVKYLANIMQV